MKTKQNTPTAGSQETRDRIIDAAEALFADNGFRSVSLRQITHEAGVNIAAVNYHFGSRESLVFEVLDRVIAPINEQRLSLLTEAEIAHGSEPVPIREILDALYRPVVTHLSESNEDNTNCLKLAGRCLSAPQEQFPVTILKIFAEVAERFGAATAKSLPHLNQIDIYWRIHFSIGTMLFAITQGEQLQLFSRGKINSIKPEETLSRLISFTAGGLEAETVKKRPSPKNATLSAFAAALLLFTSSCSMANSPKDAKHFARLKTPPHWIAGNTYQHDSYADRDWVSRFGDKNLCRFIDDALAHNRSLKSAQSRIEIARANARVAGADLYPQISGGLNGIRTKQNFIGFPIPGAPPGSVLSTTTNQFGLSLNLSWELDLWGRVKAAESSAIASFEASRFDMAAAELSIAGQAVKAWFALAEARDQTTLNLLTLSVYQQTERSIQERFENGVAEAGQSLGSQLLLAKTDVATARDTLAARKELAARASRQLEVLAGRYPAGKAGKTAKLPDFPSSIPAGLPATLLDRRPDLAAAERRIAAADQQLLEAKKTLLPSIGLTTSTGTTTERIGDLLNDNFSVWSLAGNLAQPILQGGRLRANIKRRDAERNLAAAEFEQASLTAFSEVENALAAEKFLANRIAALEDAARFSLAAFRRSREEYNEGTGDLLTMLTAQQRAFVQQSHLLTLKRSRLDNRVDLHLALGGSFRNIPPPADKQKVLANQRKREEKS